MVRHEQTDWVEALRWRRRVLLGLGACAAAGGLSLACLAWAIRRLFD